MMKKSTVSLSLVAVLAGGVSGACSARYVRSTGPNPAIASKPSATLPEHVILVSIDGLRHDAIRRFGAANLQRLLRDRSYTPAATTSLPSKPLPSHPSTLAGHPPDRPPV